MGKPKKPTKRQPTETEALEMKAARAECARRPERHPVPPLSVRYLGPNNVEIGVPHADATGWGEQIKAALGVDSFRVAAMLMNDVGSVNATGISSQDEADAMAKRDQDALEFIASVRPQSTLEATLALQMLVSHRASMKMSRHLHATDNRLALNDYARLMNQSMRTFTAQVETLAKLRNGGKQQVEVRYVYVDARTQTLVAGGLEGGEAQQNGEQPHAPNRFVGHASSPGLPMWSEDAGRDALPVARHPGPPALQDAWGTEPGRASGGAERQLPRGSVDQGDDRGAGDGQGLGEDCKEAA